MSGFFGKLLGLENQLYTNIVSLAGAVLTVAQPDADNAESASTVDKPTVSTDDVAPISNPLGICRICCEFNIDRGRLFTCEDNAETQGGCPGMFHQSCASLPNHRVCTSTIQCLNHIEEEGRQFASAFAIAK
jgi:hypothetical protein